MCGTYLPTLPYRVRRYMSTYCLSLIRYLECNVITGQIPDTRTHGLNLLGVAQVALGGVYPMYEGTSVL